MYWSVDLGNDFENIDIFLAEIRFLHDSKTFDAIKTIHLLPRVIRLMKLMDHQTTAKLNELNRPERQINKIRCNLCAVSKSK